MNRIDLTDLLNEERFTPFRIITKLGFKISVACDYDRRNILVGANQIVLMDMAGRFTHIPYHSIEQITELQPQ